MYCIAQCCVSSKYSLLIGEQSTEKTYWVSCCSFTIQSQSWPSHIGLTAVVKTKWWKHHSVSAKGVWIGKTNWTELYYFVWWDNSQNFIKIVGTEVGILKTKSLGFEFMYYTVQVVVCHNITCLQKLCIWYQGVCTSE